MPKYFEFFCGGGMVRAALPRSWECVFANDFDPKKGKAYEENWGSNSLVVGDVKNVRAAELFVKSGREAADLAWASFPCQDLSLAGAGAGLRGDRSGTFWPFHNLMRELNARRAGPSIIALENVCGTLTSHEGKDFAAIVEAFSDLGYRVGAVVIDAAHFLPHSRPRLFVVCVKRGLKIPEGLIAKSPKLPWHPASLIKAHQALPKSCARNWIWWNLPKPRSRRIALSEIIETTGIEASWHSPEETEQLLSMMTDANYSKVQEARSQGRRVVGTLFRRTRYELGEGKVQRVEVRFDGKAGCLRTPAGGSSRQLVIEVGRSKVRTRLMSPRECARLMGLPESYQLPQSFNEALHLTGDGVAVPVVRFINSQLFMPLLAARQYELELAA